MKSTLTKSPRGKKGGAALAAKAAAQMGERRRKVELWLELRQVMNSTNAARALGSHDMQMRNWARQCGLDVPLLPSGGAGAKAEQMQAFRDWQEKFGLVVITEPLKEMGLRMLKREIEAWKAALKHLGKEEVQP